MEEKLYWVWLNQIKGLGPVKIKRLLDYFDDPEGIWTGSIEELSRVEGIGLKLAQKVSNSKSHFKWEKEYHKITKSGIKLVTLADKCYPKLLKEIYDAPILLYYKGDLSRVNQPALAVVGSRNCTVYGKAIAQKLSNRLAELGISIISGMARGIDTAAHQGAINSGITYAILGSGLDIVYPPENNKLMNGIIKDGGAVISSFPIGTKPLGQNFPARNRIISGMSLGTIVVEATKKSGSLITANLALEQGRDIFAIPGDITRKQSVGVNNLIKQGAKLVQNIDDIVEELSLSSFRKERLINKDEVQLNKYTEQAKVIKTLESTEKLVYKKLSYDPKQFEYLLNVIELNAVELNSILLELELKGLIEQLPGRRFRVAV